MLVYVDNITPRLQYTCAFIFEKYLGISYSLTNNLQYFEETNTPKINYSVSPTRCRYTLLPVPLLFENLIREQEIICFENDGYKAFFKTPDSRFAFDIFAATFYLLSRYEEYLPHKKDLYGRYAHENSIAFKEDFLQQPLVNIWLIKFSNSLKEVYPELEFKKNFYAFLPTYDIDIAWSFKNKGFLRDFGGLLLRPSLERIAVLQGKKRDPYDCFELLHRLHNDFLLDPIYFFLAAGNRGRYDKNSSLSSEDLKSLIKDHADKYTIGIHPSWKSNNENGLLEKEKDYLSAQLGGKPEITSSRQHYLKFNLPETFSRLIAAGIKNEYSMGYGTVNGFRASIASSFYWYDLQKERQTELELHPFCFMDATCAFQQGQSSTEAYAELLYYYSVCKEVDGRLITIFHNNILGGNERFKDWPAMYKRFISVVAGDTIPS